MNQTKYRVVTEIVTVTPAMAVEWLKTNVGNRPLSKNNIAAISKEMTAGRWQLNGEAIKFDHQDRLIDGQHRLTACCRTGTPFQSLIVRGVNTEAFDTLDTGKSRMLSDVLAIHGKTNTGKLGAGIRAAMLLERKQLLLDTKITNQEAMEWFNKNPNIVNFASPGPVVRSLFPSMVYCGLHYLLHQQHPLQSALFFEQLETGLGLQERSAVKTLRDKLIVQKGKMAKFNPIDILALTIKAWNYFLAGQCISRINWDRKDGFPDFK